MLAVYTGVGEVMVAREELLSERMSVPETCPVYLTQPMAYEASIPEVNPQHPRSLPTPTRSVFRM